MRMTSEANRRIGRWSTMAGGAGVLAVAAVMMLAPAAAAASPAVVYRAPYKNLPESSSFGVSNAGCAKGKSIKAPSWSSKKGVFKVAGSVSAPPCKVGSNAYSYSDWDGSWNTQQGFYFTSNGSHSVSWAWKLKMSDSWKTSSYTCNLNYKATYSECYSWAYVYVEAGFEVFDETNFSQFNVAFSTITTNSSGSENYSASGSGGNFSFGSPGAWSGVYSGTTVANMTGTYAIANDSNEYYMYFTVIAIAIAYAYTTSAGSSSPVTASAAVNMGTGGNEFSLQSITIA